MGNLALTNTMIWVHDQDMSGYENEVAVKLGAAAKPATTFASAGWLEFKGGLRTIDFAQVGLWSAPAPDSQRFAALGVSDRAVTICPEGAETKTAYIFQAGDFDYSMFDKVGEMVPFAVTAKGTNAIGAVRGQLASTSRTISATGQVGSILTMAGPSATQYIYATLHVFTAGTTVTVTVESAPLIGFGAPTLRATFGPITTTGGTFLTRVVGPFTDGFWRFNATVVTGSFVLGGAIGIQ